MVQTKKFYEKDLSFFCILWYTLIGDNFEVFVQNEKTQNLLKKCEINSKIAQINTIFAFNEKISNNKNILLEQISPIYLRASQAEIERQKRISNDE